MVTANKETPIDSQTQATIDGWLTGSYDEATKQEVRSLLERNRQEAVDAFYTSLSFGTGGLRGIMGVGTNRMNAYTVRGATQGLANYLNQQPPKGEKHRVFIGYDCRHNSPEFSMEAAKVLAANGIEVFLTEELRPTPLVSFGCRHLKCSAAIMVTASHNPPAYNGYKVYWEDGGQILPPHDQGLVQEVSLITDLSEVKVADASDPLIHKVGRDIDAPYLAALDHLQSCPEVNREHGASLKVVYANLHGTGITLIPEALKRWGFSTLETVKEQDAPDGDFPTVVSPNPEEREALTLGIEKLKQTESDLLLATDPDTDRMGLAVRHQGDAVLLNGNQIACIALKHICEVLQSSGRLPENGAFVKTIVTSELFAAIAQSYDRPCFDVLTGFKYIAEKIREWEDGSYQYLFGGEESYGYLLGTHARDKDAVVACCLIAEVALKAKLANKTLVDLLYELYADYGVYRETLVSLKFEETKAGREKMAAALTRLRAEPPIEFAGVPVVTIEDYQASTRQSMKGGQTVPLTLPKSNVLLYWLEDHSKVVVRPSGTEPKVKLYCGVTREVGESVESAVNQCDEQAEALVKALEARLSS